MLVVLGVDVGLVKTAEQNVAQEDRKAFQQQNML